ncbi:cytochrome c methyltransferase [Scheffersomyces coipomensis]|uniref:cytochrome c methyltransferase n=1 Tax=Scheffersomyces coipomensis TaxID=1788519 RepID=UPI00315DAD48
MSIIGERITIPGVYNNQRLVDWIEDNKITYHPQLSINKSKLGGIGLFFNNDVKEELEKEEDLIILTIPESCTFDYMNLLEVLKEIKIRDQTFPDIEIKEGELIVNLLEIIEPTKETEILICYFVSMKILKEIQNVNSIYYKQSPLRKFDIYLDILLNTKILTYPKIDKNDKVLESIINMDSFIKNHIQRCQYLKFDYDSYVGELNVLYDHDINFEEYIIPFETYYQIVQAVRSRSLEIPHEHQEIIEQVQAIEKDVSQLNEQSELNGNVTLEDLVNGLHVDDKEESSNNGEAVESSADDYYTNVTLVPILDFANHTHHNNSYFDIDRSNKDIVLKLKREALNKWKQTNEKRFEITINYSPIESIQNFITTYGFIPIEKDPQDKYFQLYELQLINSNKYYPHITEMFKWLRILPQIQIVFNQDEVYFNFNDNKLPIVFAKGISYNSEWRKDAIPKFKLFNDIPIDYDIDDDKILRILNQQETEFDVINGIEPIGIKYQGKIIEDVNEVFEKVNDDKEVYDQLILNSIEFIIYHVNDKLKVLKENIDTLVQSQYDRDSNDSFNQMMINYFNLQIKIFNIAISKFKKDPHSLILPDELVNHEWETNYRSLPKELILD